MMQEYLTYNQIIKDEAVSSDTTTPWISRNAEALCPLVSLHLVGAATIPVSFWSLLKFHLDLKRNIFQTSKECPGVLH